jgi:enoyl-CoA hydratase/carnithine racemase
MRATLNYLQLTEQESEYIQTHLDEGVVTIMMNKPKKLNGWTSEMMAAFRSAFEKAKADDGCKVVIFTGTGNYYCAGVNLGGTLKLMAPKKLHTLIIKNNEALFDLFLTFPKPILVAVNGPAIGASVTSATLCDGIIASETATFSTPFAALGITPEGCSSIQFARLMGEENAKRMLFSEGWRPNAQEALEVGLIQHVAPAETLQQQAQAIAVQWVKENRKRSFLGGSELTELQTVNARESVELANCFLSGPFLKGQTKFLWSKKKHVPAMMFFLLWVLRPLWRLFL